MHRGSDPVWEPIHTQLCKKRKRGGEWMNSFICGLAQRKRKMCMSLPLEKYLTSLKLDKVTLKL